jgi:uncharacterized protein YcfL
MSKKHLYVIIAILALFVLVGCAPAQPIEGTVVGKEYESALLDGEEEFDITLQARDGDVIEVTVDKATFDRLQPGDHYRAPVNVDYEDSEDDE